MLNNTIMKYLRLVAPPTERDIQCVQNYVWSVTFSDSGYRN